MKICVKEIYNGNNWRRGGSNIKYIENSTETNKEKNTYELHFSYFFKNHFLNTVEFAYCFPYTYTKLYDLFSVTSDMMKIDVLGKTFENRDVHLLTIGNEKSPYAIVLSSRVHPGETVGSYIMEGFLK